MNRNAKSACDESDYFISGKRVAAFSELDLTACLTVNNNTSRIAKALIEKFIETVREKETQVIFLEVRSGNLAAITLYEKCGFVFCGLRKDYYSDPKENALLMRLAFDGTQEYEEWDDEDE